MLQSIEQEFLVLIKFLKDNNKLNVCFDGFDNFQIMNIYIEDYCSKKIDLEQKVDKIIIKGARPIYRTEKGYKSSKLDSLFLDFYNFLAYTPDEIKEIILNHKVEIVDEKFNLEYDNPKRDYDSMEIKFIKLLEMLNDAIKKSPNGSLNIAHKELLKILI
tara:strand:- start:48 stop:527 length:480 start_codon:yes stop_codon:yes gene_type:complete